MNDLLTVIASYPRDEEPVMKAKWAMLYLKYRRYLIPAAVVLVLVVAAYFIWGR